MICSIELSLSSQSCVSNDMIDQRAGEALADLVERTCGIRTFATTSL
jgi:hypothetical protein